MKRTLLLAIYCLTISSLSAQYTDPNFSKPSAGYGSDGSHPVDVVSFINPNFPTKKIEIYHPQDITTPVPTIFYSHAYGGNVSDNISGMLNFVAAKGYAIVYVPYQTTGVTVEERYANLLHGFRMAARNYSSIIDTTRVGFMGHSFGGGASFGNAFTCFTENNWGQNGRFIYALAQWYSYNLSPDNLLAFPSDTRLLVEIFDDDVTNDHRLAADIFRHINISNDEKDFLVVKSSTVNGYTYSAEHNLPNTSTAFDALDYYAYYRFIDALCDYTFNNNALGKDVALGNGSTAQTSMPTGMLPLIETDAPTVTYPQSKYLFPCESNENLRSAYCNEVETSVNGKSRLYNRLQLYSNPVVDKANLILPVDAVNYPVIIYNGNGEIIQRIHPNGYCNVEIDASHFTKGLYLISVSSYQIKMVKQ